MARATQQLFLQIGGSADGLTAASKAGRTALLNMGSAAGDVADEVRKAFADLGKTNVEATAKDIERTYNRTFDKIRENARAVVDAPTPHAAVQVIDVAAARQVAQSAEMEASALRVVADAAARAANATQGDASAARVYAVAAEAAAIGAHDHALALREQVTVLQGIQAQLPQTTGAVAQSGRQFVVSAGQQRQGVLQLGEQFRQFATEVSLGINPVVAFTQQSGQAAFALTNFGGKLGAVGNFMAGPWGTIGLVAISVLGNFAFEAIKAGNAVDDAAEKLKKDAVQTAATRDAKERFKTTLEGVTEAIHDGTDATKKSIEAEKSSAEQANLSAKAHLSEMIAIREKTKAKLEDAKAELVALSKPGASDARLAPARDEVQSGVTKLDKQLADNDKLITEAQARLQNTRINLAAEEAARMADPLARIKKLYDDKAHAAEDAARKEIAAGKQVTSALTDQLAKIERERKSAIAAEEKRQASAKAKGNNNQLGREITVSDATAIVASIGGRVTSGLRSTADQERIYADKLAGRHDGPVAKPGTSDHERGQAVDIAYGPGITIAKIREAFTKQGVALRQILDEPAQRVFHVAFGKKGPSKETIDKQADAAEQKRIRDDEAFAQLKGRAQEEYLRLQRAQVGDIATAADLDADAVDLERQRLNSAAQAGVAEKRWLQGKADQLVELNNASAALKTEQIRRQETHDLLEQHLAVDRTDLQDKSNLLALQGRIAVTRQEQLDNELQLLAIQEEIIKREALKIIQDPNARVVDKIAAEHRIATVDDQHDANVQDAKSRHLDPMQSYRKSLEENVGDMNDALKGVKANGLKSVEDGLLGILDGTQSVAGAFKKMASSIIADLARIAVEKLILKVISGGLFADGTVPGHATGIVPGFATGVVDGIIRGPGTGRSDSILGMMGKSLIRVSNGESIMTEAATRRYGPTLKAMNDNAINDNDLPGFATGFIPAGAIRYSNIPDARQLQRASGNSQPITFDLRGAVMTDDLLRQMNAISQQHATVAVVAGSALAQQEIADQQSTRIP